MAGSWQFQKIIYIYVQKYTKLLCEHIIKIIKKHLYYLITNRINKIFIK